jgi:hypothetical protein
LYDVVEYQCFGGPSCLHLQDEGVPLLFADNQVSIDTTEDGLQCVVNNLQITASGFDVSLSEEKNKSITFLGKGPI